jgi:glycerophosphoryl diester phosphodiesterase
LDVGHSAVVPDVGLILGEGRGDQVRDCGLDVYVWTVNDLATAEKLVAIGVSGIITDDPGLISSIRDTQ